jgi:hypothetical protein
MSARVQRRDFFECQGRLDIRSDRYFAAGDGAARHPYHRAVHIPGILPAEEAWMPIFVPPWLNSSERIV